MARNQVPVHVPTNDWVELTGGDATVITWNIVTNEEKLNGVYLRTTDDTTKPTEQYGLHFSTWDDPEINRTIANYRAGAGSPKRVWAKAIKEAVVVLVSDNSV
jgi:hypothetical protein